VRPIALDDPAHFRIDCLIATERVKLARRDRVGLDSVVTRRGAL
jgi:hypothetical protein